MKLGGKMLVCLLGGVGLCITAKGITDAHTPYEQIVARNVFALKPPPPPAPPPEEKAPPVKITLTGITTLIGKRALMETPAAPAKPGQPAGTKHYYMLGEGQQEDDIEVLQIDEGAGSVKVRNGGQEFTLTFEKDGAKLPATQPPPAVPGLPGALPGVPPSPTGVSMPQMRTAEARMHFPSFPQRTVRTANEGVQAGVHPGFVGSGTVPNGLATTPGTVGLPSFNSPQAANNMSQAAMPDKLYTREEQAILIEANRASGSPFSALLPPTPLTPHPNVVGAEQPGAPAPGQAPQQIPMPPIPGQPQFPPPPGGG